MINNKQFGRALKLKDNIIEIKHDISQIEDMAMRVANGAIEVTVDFSLRDVTKPVTQQAKLPSLEDLFKRAEEDAKSGNGKAMFKFQLDEIEEQEEIPDHQIIFRGSEFLIALQGMLVYKKKRLETWEAKLAKIIND